jgi:hypothetical protein
MRDATARNRTLLVTTAALVTSAIGGIADTRADTPSQVPPAIQEARRHMLDPGINTLTFRSMERLFDTRQVSRAGPVWVLPKNEAPLDFRYSVGGQSLAATEFAGRTFTNALVIIKRGRIVFEQYRNLSDDRSHFASFSLAKSIVSMVVGAAVADGYIQSIEDPVRKYVPELKGSGYEKVPIRELLRMRSGVAYDERYDFGVQSEAQQVHELAVVQNVQRFADISRRLKLTRKPGEAFNYSTMDTAVLGWVIEKAVRQPLSKYMSARIWEPAGMESYGFWIADGPPGVGREMSGMGYNATARDFARLGQLMLQRGRVGDRQILPTDWIDAATASTAIGVERQPIKTAFALGYGYQWWTLHGTGSYTGIGLQGQYIYVDPATETVVAKLSHYPPGFNDPLDDEAFAFFRAVSAWNP